jgi:hypothetical protein
MFDLYVTFLYLYVTYGLSISSRGHLKEKNIDIKIDIDIL